MAIPSVALAYRRSALMTATKVTAKPPSEEVLKARDDFKDFCTVMGKAPARHMLEWHRQLCTGEDSECLIGVGGPNTAILAPRGSAKSTVLGLFAAWMIGIASYRVELVCRGLGACEPWQAFCKRARIAVYVLLE